jgi:hypothetical protein
MTGIIVAMLEPWGFLPTAINADGCAGKETCTYGERCMPDDHVAAGFLPAPHTGW